MVKLAALGKIILVYIVIVCLTQGLDYIYHLIPNTSTRGTAHSIFGLLMWIVSNILVNVFSFKILHKSHQEKWFVVLGTVIILACSALYFFKSIYILQVRLLPRLVIYL